MGVVVDLTQRLTVQRRLRGLLRESQSRSIVQTRLSIEAIEIEVRQQEALVCSRLSNIMQVEEAVAGLELLAEVLAQRRRYLTQLEQEYFTTSLL